MELAHLRKLGCYLWSSAILLPAGGGSLWSRSWLIRKSKSFVLKRGPLRPLSWSAASSLSLRMALISARCRSIARTCASLTLQSCLPSRRRWWQSISKMELTKTAPARARRRKRVQRIAQTRTRARNGRSPRRNLWRTRRARRSRTRRKIRFSSVQILCGGGYKAWSGIFVPLQVSPGERRNSSCSSAVFGFLVLSSPFLCGCITEPWKT